MGRSTMGAVIAVALSGCAGRPVPMPIAAPAPPVVAPTPIAPTPVNAGLSPAATLWHLRAGLNVAALACPGAAVLAARYNQLLASRVVALREAQTADAASYQAAGGDWRDRYDDDQTRLYNFWAQARGRDGLCRAAGEALESLAVADDAALPAVAAKQLARLDQSFAPPRLEVDASVFTGPARVMVAMR